jgi:hypothetical protein
VRWLFGKQYRAIDTVRAQSKRRAGEISLVIAGSRRQAAAAQPDVLPLSHDIVVAVS